jgi:hypothetical protein
LNQNFLRSRWNQADFQALKARQVSLEDRMHKFLIIAATALSLAACTTTQQGATVGALGGAVVGAAATGGSAVGTLVGAGVGGVVGAAAGDVLGRVEGSSDRCVYQRPNGSRYVDTCPRG